MSTIQFMLSFKHKPLLESVIEHILKKEFQQVSEIMSQFMEDVDTALKPLLKVHERACFSVETEIRKGKAWFSVKISIEDSRGSLASFPNVIWATERKVYGYDENYRKSGFELVRYDANYQRLIQWVISYLIATRDCDVC